MQALNRNTRLIIRLAFRYTLVWVADAASIGATALVLPGIYFTKETDFWYLDPFVVALEFALLNVLVRPVLMILLLPINFISLGLTTLVLNSLLFYLMATFQTTFVIESFPAALIGLLVLSTVNTVLEGIMHLEEEYSLFSLVMDKLGTMTGAHPAQPGRRGLVVIQVDGLSFNTLKRAVSRGKMPFVGDLLSRRGYRVRRWFSGIPSQTSSVQAGLFYGSQHDIPGFRWYDKDLGKQFVSSSSADMHQVDERLGGGDGILLQEGTCVNTLIHGGAKKRLLTLSALFEKDIKKRKAELEDFAIFSLHPYLYNRAIVLMIWDFLIDRLQSALDIVRQKRPRVKRSIKFSFLRAVSNAFLREGITFFVCEDLVRGVPVVYANYIGYDVIAHHAGPTSWDAMSALTGIDRQIKKIGRTMAKKAGRPYDLVILSDHGQSRSIPFRQLYGRSLEDLVEEIFKRPLVRTSGYSAERGYLATLLEEMEMAERAHASARIRKSRLRLERIRARVWEESGGALEKEGVMVCSTGNLSHLYLTEHQHRLSLEELAELYPALVETLAAHPGIGFLLARKRDGEAVALASRGLRSLRTGKVEGDDPLAPYPVGEAVLAALRALAEYPHSGDLILNGALLADGSVVAFEDHVGTHGGLGGEQTEALVVCTRDKTGLENPIRGPLEMNRFLRRLSAS